MFAPHFRQLVRCSVSFSRKSSFAVRRLQHGPTSPEIMTQRHRRAMSTPPPQLNHSDINVDLYHQLSDSTMNNLLEALEDLLDNVGNADYEVEYHSGVLTLKLGEKGTYVINKQPPNKQIWLSSPYSGPKRYDYSELDDDWLYSRDSRAMGDLLNEELSKALDMDVNLEISKVSATLSR